MKRVFDHIDFTVVGHLQSLLESEGIRTEIRNEGASRAAGELPISEVYPELWVLNNADETKAKAIIREFRQAADSTPTGPDWICPACKELVDGVFSECWNCGNPAPATA